VGLAAQRQGVDLGDQAAVERLMGAIALELTPGAMETGVILNGEDVSSAIRTPEMGMMASKISALAPVRRTLTALQQAMAARQSVVAEGRDMGTVVFPQARHKFYLSASAEERARRRTAQLAEKGIATDAQEILAQIEKRDHDDSARALAPLKPATDAIIIDSSTMTIDQVVQHMLDTINGN